MAKFKISLADSTNLSSTKRLVWAISKQEAEAFAKRHHIEIKSFISGNPSTIVFKGPRLLIEDAMKEFASHSFKYSKLWSHVNFGSLVNTGA